MDTFINVSLLAKSGVFGQRSTSLTCLGLSSIRPAATQDKVLVFIESVLEEIVGAWRPVRMTDGTAAYQLTFGGLIIGFVLHMLTHSLTHTHTFWAGPRTA